MDNSNALVPAQSLEVVRGIAKHALESRAFRDLKSQDAAIVKILAGQELGLPAFVSIRGIDFFDGQISLRAHLIAAVLTREGKYDYKVKESTGEKCVLEFYRKSLDGSAWELRGTSEWTIEDAKRAGLTGKDNWRKYPRAMLYNRAMSEGARMYAPDMTLGAIYETDSEEIERPSERPSESAIEAEYTDVEPDRGEVPPASKGETEGVYGSYTPKPATVQQIKYATSLMAQAGVQAGNAHSLLEEVLGPDPLARDVSVEIETLKETGAMSNKLFGAYIMRIRQLAGMDQAQIGAFCKEQFNTPKPFNLNGEQQRKLIQYIENPTQSDDDPELAVDNVYTEEINERQSKILRLINDLAESTFTPYDDVVSYFMRETDGKFEDIIDMDDATLAQFQANIAKVKSDLEKGPDDIPM